MEIITKDRFTALWSVIVEDQPASVEPSNGDCAMKISNGVSERLAKVLIDSANGKHACLAERFKVA